MSSLFTTVVLTIITLFLLGYIARMRSMCPPAVFNRREKFISIFFGSGSYSVNNNCYTINTNKSFFTTMME